MHTMDVLRFGEKICEVHLTLMNVNVYMMIIAEYAIQHALRNHFELEYYIIYFRLAIPLLGLFYTEVVDIWSHLHLFTINSKCISFW